MKSDKPMDRCCPPEWKIIVHNQNINIHWTIKEMQDFQTLIHGRHEYSISLSQIFIIFCQVCSCSKDVVDCWIFYQFLLNYKSIGNDEKVLSYWNEMVKNEEFMNRFSTNVRDIGIHEDHVKEEEKKKLIQLEQLEQLQQANRINQSHQSNAQNETQIVEGKDEQISEQLQYEENGYDMKCCHHKRNTKPFFDPNVNIRPIFTFPPQMAMQQNQMNQINQINQMNQMQYQQQQYSNQMNQYMQMNPYQQYPMYYNMNQINQINQINTTEMNQQFQPYVIPIDVSTNQIIYPQMVNVNMNHFGIGMPFVPQQPIININMNEMNQHIQNGQCNQFANMNQFDDSKPLETQIMEELRQMTAPNQLQFNQEMSAQLQQNRQFAYKPTLSFNEFTQMMKSVDELKKKQNVSTQQQEEIDFVYKQMDNNNMYNGNQLNGNNLMFN